VKPYVVEIEEGDGEAVIDAVRRGPTKWAVRD